MPLDEDVVEHDSGYDPYNSATTRTPPPIPAWLRNDPELEAIARVVVSNLPGWRSYGVETGSWSSGRYAK